jgi:hypothetical protein
MGKQLARWFHHRSGRVRTCQVLSLTMTLKGLPGGLFRYINRTARVRPKTSKGTTISQWRGNLSAFSIAPPTLRIVIPMCAVA